MRVPDETSSGGGARRELILDLLRASSQPRSIVSLAEQLRVHPNTVRFHLDALLRTEQVEQVLGETTGPGRPPTLFRATHRMDPAGPTNYRLLATMLTSHLARDSPHPASTAADLGRAWGPHLIDPSLTSPVRRRTGRAEALTRTTNMLAELGFAPEAPTGRRDTTIKLRHCPFLGLVGDPAGGADAGDYRNVICSLHLGMMQGALAALNSPVTVDRLEPFREPDLCVAHLVATKGPATAPTTDE